MEEEIFYWYFFIGILCFFRTVNPRRDVGGLLERNEFEI